MCRLVPSCIVFNILLLSFPSSFLNISCSLPACVLLPLTDLDKMDSEKDEMNHADIAALHHFYSRHISDIPDDQALTELFAQVKPDVDEDPYETRSLRDQAGFLIYNVNNVCEDSQS